MPEAETRTEYIEFSNAVAGALIEWAQVQGLPHPRFSDRYRIADHAWRALHPDSPFGDAFGPWPARAEVVPEPPTPGLLGLAWAGIAALWRRSR